MTYVEAIRTDEEPSRVQFRFRCAACQIAGALHSTLQEAEEWAERHRRVKHPKVVSA